MLHYVVMLWYLMLSVIYVLLCVEVYCLLYCVYCCVIWVVILGIWCRGQVCKYSVLLWWPKQIPAYLPGYCDSMPSVCSFNIPYHDQHYHDISYSKIYPAPAMKYHSIPYNFIQFHTLRKSLELTFLTLRFLVQGERNRESTTNSLLGAYKHK